MKYGLLENLPFIWVNDNISLTWIKAIWGWFPLLTIIPRARLQWGRYNLPRFIWEVFKTSIKTEWKLFILARNPCAILARPQWELARGQFFKLSLRDLARRWIPEIWWFFACAMQARSWFRTWVSWLLRFLARSVVSQLLDFLACPVASRLLGSNQRSSYFASSVVPECLHWVYGLEPGYNQYSGMVPSPCSGFA